MDKEEITEKAQELTIKNVTDGKNKYFSWGFYKGCVVGLEYNNKQKTLTREKAIKLYWKIAKERCPFQEEEMVNSFLEGFIDCAEYLLLQNTELEKENTELIEIIKKLASKESFRALTLRELRKLDKIMNCLNKRSNL